MFDHVFVLGFETGVDATHDGGEVLTVRLNALFIDLKLAVVVVEKIFCHVVWNPQVLVHSVLIE